MRGFLAGFTGAPCIIGVRSRMNPIPRRACLGSCQAESFQTRCTIVAFPGSAAGRRTAWGTRRLLSCSLTLRTLASATGPFHRPFPHGPWSSRMRLPPPWSIVQAEPWRRTCVAAGRPAVISCSETAPEILPTTHSRTELPFGGTAIQNASILPVMRAKLAPMCARFGAPMALLETGCQRVCATLEPDSDAVDDHGRRQRAGVAAPAAWESSLMMLAPVAGLDAVR